ncbi:MAG: anaerobic carbon-monoxide dehydrogenase catalytic subunit [Chloroflexi bacterium]|nr:anaerobic carbon-monoxide dehydrogenase catalytic subunit [Chloroflexota bacterium]
MASIEREFPEGYSEVTNSWGTAIVLRKAREDGVQTAWDRSTIIKPCPIGTDGVCCNTCSMGPCRLNEDRPDRFRGVCGASVPTIVARSFTKMIAQGCACHSDHGRSIAETFLKVARGEAAGYQIKDFTKLYALAADLGVNVQGMQTNDIAEQVGIVALNQFSQQHGEMALVKRVPAKRLQLWRQMGIVPRGVDREVVEAMHRTNMGMDQDYKNLMRQASRTALADGWGGSMIATELQDILFSTPNPQAGKLDFGVLDADYVNIVVHGHEPLLSDPLVDYATAPEVLRMCEEVGAKGVNVVGMCCTANELLTRHGVPLVGNFAQQELVIATGVVDAMVVDYQCVLETLPVVAQRYHTKVITTSNKCRIPGSLFIEFEPTRVASTVKEIYRTAITNYPNRTDRVLIPDQDSQIVAGFSFEYTKYMMGGSFRASYRPLNDAIIDGRIRGVAAVVGCDSPVIRNGARAGAAHEELVRELIANDVLVAQTGCSASTCGKTGLLLPEAQRLAGSGLQSICEALGIPPVLHVGSCVDNSRLLVALAEMAAEGGLGDDISDLPVAGAAPEWIDAKALTIGQYFADYGVLVVFRPKLHIEGSKEFQKYLFEDYEAITGGKWAHADTPAEVASLMIDHIDKKRRALGIHERRERVLFDMAMRRELGE